MWNLLRNKAFRWAPRKKWNWSTCGELLLGQDSLNSRRPWQSVQKLKISRDKQQQWVFCICHTSGGIFGSERVITRDDWISVVTSKELWHQISADSLPSLRRLFTIVYTFNCDSTGFLSQRTFQSNFVVFSSKQALTQAARWKRLHLQFTSISQNKKFASLSRIMGWQGLRGLHATNDSHARNKSFESSANTKC